MKRVIGMLLPVLAMAVSPAFAEDDGTGTPLLSEAALSTSTADAETQMGCITFAEGRVTICPDSVDDEDPTRDE